MLLRNMASRLQEALGDTPVVLLNGARQTGKSTLVNSLVGKDFPGSYRTLDDPAVLAAAQQDPAGFLASAPGPLVLDEIQRAPELFLAMKAAVDRNRKPGQFLLTGSANILLLPRIAESLAGRIEILTLWPFSQGELEGHKEEFIDTAFAGRLPGKTRFSLDREDLLHRVFRGGFPEVTARASAARRAAWFASYVITLLERDIRNLAEIEGLTALPRLLSLMAARAGGLLNQSELSRITGIPLTTMQRYVTLLEAAYLVQPLPAWSGNLGKRLVKSSKLYLGDTGLLAHLLGANEARLVDDPNLLGPLLENFVVMELRKQITWSRTQPQLLHFRTHTGQEVDLILEDRAGRMVGIEVKARMAASGDDFKPLRALADKLGKRFVAGVVFYTGANPLPFGQRMWALPVSALWQI